MSRTVRGAGGGRPASTSDWFTSRPLGQLPSPGTLMSRARVMVDGSSCPSSWMPRSSCCAVSATSVTGGAGGPAAAGATQATLELVTVTGPHRSWWMVRLLLLLLLP